MGGLQGSVDCARTCMLACNARTTARLPHAHPKPPLSRGARRRVPCGGHGLRVGLRVRAAGAVPRGGTRPARAQGGCAGGWVGASAPSLGSAGTRAVAACACLCCPALLHRRPCKLRPPAVLAHHTTRSPWLGCPCRACWGCWTRRRRPAGGATRCQTCWRAAWPPAWSPPLRPACCSCRPTSRQARVEAGGVLACWWRQLWGRRGGSEAAVCCFTAQPVGSELVTTVCSSPTTLC